MKRNKGGMMRDACGARARVGWLIAWLAVLSLAVMLVPLGCGADDDGAANDGVDAEAQAQAQAVAERAAELREMTGYETPQLAHEAWRLARHTEDWTWLPRTVTEAGLRQFAASEIAAYRQAGRSLGLDALGLGEATASGDAHQEARLAEAVAAHLSLPELLATLEAMHTARTQGAARDEAAPTLAAVTHSLRRVTYEDAPSPGWAVAEVAHGETDRALGWIALRRAHDGDGGTQAADASAGWKVAGEPAVRTRIRGMRELEPLPAAQAVRNFDGTLHARFLGTHRQDEMSVAECCAASPATGLVVFLPGALRTNMHLANEGDAAFTHVTLQLAGYDIRREPLEETDLAEFRVPLTPPLEPGEQRTLSLDAAELAPLTDAAYARVASLYAQ